MRMRYINLHFTRLLLLYLLKSNGVRVTDYNYYLSPVTTYSAMMFIFYSSALSSNFAVYVCKHAILVVMTSNRNQRHFQN